MTVSFKPIRPLLQTGAKKSARWFSYAGLAIGVLLLLCSIQMFLNIQQLLSKNVIRKNGSDFISITKTITNSTMGQLDKNLFNESEIKEVSAQPFIEGVAPLIANRFQVTLSAGNIIPFSTSFFLESVDNDFIDTVPPNFTWHEGQDYVPMIFSADFLEIYNVFAPGYGLPQLSQATASKVVVLITCGKDNEQQTFNASIVAFSDRINSIIVPKTFLDWANKKFGNATTVKASRLYVKVKDVNDPAFVQFLSEKNYKVNKDRTKFGREKLVLQGIFTGIGFFGILVVALSLMLFSFYLQLMIARSKDNLQLLLTLGYSPAWLSKKVSSRFIPIYLVVVLVALALTQILQAAFSGLMEGVITSSPTISFFISWIVVAIALVMVLLSFLINYRMVRRILYKMY